MQNISIEYLPLNLVCEQDIDISRGNMLTTLGGIIHSTQNRIFLSDPRLLVHELVELVFRDNGKYGKAHCQEKKCIMYGFGEPNKREFCNEHADFLKTLNGFNEDVLLNIRCYVIKEHMPPKQLFANLLKTWNLISTNQFEIQLSMEPIIDNTVYADIYGIAQVFRKAGLIAVKPYGILESRNSSIFEVRLALHKNENHIIDDWY